MLKCPRLMSHFLHGFDSRSSLLLAFSVKSTTSFGVTMKNNGFKPIYVYIFAIAILAFGGFYLNSKSENEKKNSLTKIIEKTPLKLGQVIQKNLEKNEEMHEIKMDAKSVLTMERIYTQEEIDRMNETEFKNLLLEIEHKLPKKSDLKKIPEQALHHTPAAIIEAGRNLGLIKEIIKVHKNYETMALDFYHNCTKNEETPTTVRAICLTNLVVINRLNGNKFNTNGYPKELVDLSKIVTDL